jgi:hypothetical protein
MCAGIAALSRLLELRHLSMRGCRKVRGAGLGPLAGLPHLATLNLASCRALGYAGRGTGPPTLRVPCVPTSGQMHCYVSWCYVIIVLQGQMSSGKGHELQCIRSDDLTLSSGFKPRHGMVHASCRCFFTSFYRSHVSTGFVICVDLTFNASLHCPFLKALVSVWRSSIVLPHLLYCAFVGVF